MASATLTAKLVGDAKGMVDAFDKGEVSAGKLGSSIGDVSKIVGGFVVAEGLMKIPGLLQSATAAASNLAESQSKANVVFGENAREIEAWASKASKSLGQSKQQALEAAGTFGNLFTALGLTGEQTKNMSKDVVSLATDFASFNNIGTDAALEKLRAGLVGEVEPLRALGINLTAATVEAKAMEMGLAASTKELTEADKVQARYALILEQSTNAQGDFARTADGAANQQRIMKAELADVTAKIGTGLIPVMLAGGKAILFLTEHADVLVPVLGALATVIGVILVPATWAYVSALTAQAAVFIVANAGLILIALAVAALVAIIIVVAQHWDDITAAVGRFTDYITDKAQAIIGAFVDFVDGKFGLLLLLLGPAGLLLFTVIRFRDEFVGAFEWIRDRVRDVVGGITGAIGAVIDSVQTALNMLSRLASFGGGTLGAIGGFFGGGRAVGGPVSAGGTYLVGERGPELLTMGGSGFVTPNSALGGGGTTIYLTVNSLDPQGAADGVVRALTTLESQGRISSVTVVG